MDAVYVMKYRDGKGSLDTPKKILKVNHAGEFGAINIYRSQLFIAKILMPDLVPLLDSFLQDEKRHMQIFWNEIQARNGVKCKSFWLCGIGGYFMGLVSALLGRKGIMACTWAVESVVVNHLNNQLHYLKGKHDEMAYSTVASVLEDEENHRDIGGGYGGRDNIWYGPLRLSISVFTEVVIRFGMR
ncbi:ubiquinone biosynthesis protein COQ7 [Alcanivorax balearicus MACL04]|uniref:Ubiquinone biosynthesis protein COQ7 n=1 Tax=Alloalcanivorax balearicus MACL04 TaxID=1177182 RepID=A0ABT2R037_9GAMM|nr:demethoxyubiquinone hydroxylase family protein [Alloalcanivorax balearicus]MCU5783153.1 ubiquinone biosynthesis protein COQ7 [Alloalcanivorax balearicus MACL04]